LEQTFISVNSEKEFYQKLKKQGIELYKRKGQITGIVLKRKYRFRTLGYPKSILQELNLNPSRDNRLDTLRRIRENQEQKQSKGLERTRNRSRK